MNPSVLETDIDLEQQPAIEFSKPMMLSSFGNAVMHATPATLGVGFSKRFTAIPLQEGDEGFEFYDERTEFTFYHGSALAENAEYTPHMPSTITDIAYNCFYPAQDTGSCKNTSPAKPYCCNGSASATACLVE